MTPLESRIPWESFLSDHSVPSFSPHHQKHSDNKETAMTSRKSISLLMGLILVLSMSAAALAADELYGTWQLVSYTRTIVSTGEKSDVFGKEAKGYIM